MNELDRKILEIFRKLINSGTNYLTKIEYFNKALEYNINGKKIFICMNNYEEKSNSYSKVTEICDYVSSFVSIVPDKIQSDQVSYKLIIEEKHYYVPKLERVEQAQILDKIDNILKLKESAIIDSLYNDLI